MDIDDEQKNGLYILTGSSSQVVNTPHTGTLRISTLKMYPMSLYESEESNGTVSIKDIFDNPHIMDDGCMSDLFINDLIFAICRGGWPKSFLNESERAKLEIAKDLFRQTCCVDISNIDGVSRNAAWAEIILRSYARNICTIAERKTIEFDVRGNYDISSNTINDYINTNNTLFVKPCDIGYSDEKFIELKNRFNEKLLRINPHYSEHRIIEISGYYTVESYYNSTKNVILKAVNLCKTKNIQVNNDYSENPLLSAAQKNILSKSLKNSSVALITGSAGTGKTTIIKEFIKNNPDKRILCLTTTNTANNNLKIKDFAGNITYKNIAQFEKEKHHEDCDIIIVDEASFVSTDSIEKIIEVYKSSAFMFVGDPGQIESIEFGNWFDLLLNLLKTKDVVFSLDVEYRTKVVELTKIWDEVRHGKKKNIIELLSAYEMTEEISDDIFKVQENEVVLCLNYDGLYGINNINRYLQASNPNDAFEYQQNLYKVGDPVVFITNDYSAYGIYNNLSGKIVGIKNEEENITFKIELLESVSCFGKLSNEIEIVEEGSGFYAIVTKMKYYNDKYDTDMDTRTKLPFQISYAMSIHKAQGLEFDSVKIVITKESDEQVTKNIFYTAVTRAKKNLKVYWQPEVADYVLGNIENSEESKTADLSILSEQLKKYI